MPFRLVAYHVSSGTPPNIGLAIKFTNWHSFSKDSRALQVPKPLLNALDQFCTIIESYCNRSLRDRQSGG